MTPLALAEALGRPIAAAGGRPRLEGAERRHEIALSRGHWQRLKQTAAILNHRGVRATPGQVGSVLLHEQLERLAAEGGRGAG